MRCILYINGKSFNEDGQWEEPGKARIFKTKREARELIAYLTTEEPNGWMHRYEIRSA